MLQHLTVLLVLAAVSPVESRRVDRGDSIRGAEGSSTPSDLEAPTSEGTLIRLLMVRHGQSCANVISEYGGMRKLVQHKNYPDPLLSDCGVSRTTEAAAILASEVVDFVGASPMMRAIETAYLQFGGRPVHVLPHVGEEAHGIKGAAVWLSSRLGLIDDADNTPLEEPRQREILQRHHSDIAVDYQWSNDTDASSWPHFEQFLATRLLPSIVPGNQKGVYTLGVASHSLFLQHALGKNPEPGRFGSAPSSRESACYTSMPLKGSARTKPHNNQVLELFYKYDAKSQSLTFDEERGCQSLGVTEELPVGVPSRPATICEADFQRCISGWPYAPACTPTARAQMSLEPSSKESKLAPGACATHHECNEGFPYVNTVEQKWAEEWRHSGYQSCDSNGVACDSHVNDSRPYFRNFDCLIGACPWPELPRRQQECTCAAVSTEPLTCGEK